MTARKEADSYLLSNESQVGLFCSYTPEELLLAAGLEPCRIQTNDLNISESEAYLSPNICPYVHRLFQAVVRQECQGLVFVYSCDPMRRLADVCRHYARTSFLYRLDLPRRTDAAAEEFFLDRIKDFKRFLEAESGKKIKEGDLLQAISTVNQTRSLIQELFSLQSRGYLSGWQVHRFCQRALNEDKARFNQELEKYLQKQEYQSTSGLSKTDSPVRLFLCGSLVEDRQLYSLIEDGGARIVADDLCNGQRTFQGLVETKGPPMQAIARRYLHRTDCPRMVGAKQRVKRIADLVHRHKCQGVICHSLKFCDLIQSEIPRLEREFQKRNIPFLHIERQNLDEDTGQIKTRIEAFLELIKHD